MATYSSWVTIFWSIFYACCTSDHLFFSGFEAEKGLRVIHACVVYTLFYGNWIFSHEKDRLPLITLFIVSTIPLKMAFQNTVGKGENASNNFLHVSRCFFLPFQTLSSMLFANIFKLKESKMLLFGKEISSKYSQCRIYRKMYSPLKILTL